MEFLLMRQGKYVCVRGMAAPILWAEMLKSGISVSVSSDLGGCQLNKVFESLSKKVSVNFKARNFIMFIHYSALCNVSQTISCIVAVSKIIGFG